MTHHRRDLVRSHQTAAVLWRFDLLHPPEIEHVTLGRNASRVRIAGAKVHRADLPASDIVEVDGVRFTTPTRTVLDLARTLPLPEAVALVDSAIRVRSGDLRDLRRRVGFARGTGSGRLIRAVALADPRSASFLESCCRAVLVSAGMGPDRTQYEIRDALGGFLARVDFAWLAARVVVEVDGYEFHADRERYRSDRRRLNGLELAGWLVLRFSWEDVVHQPEYVVASVAAALGRSALAA